MLCPGGTISSQYTSSTHAWISSRPQKIALLLQRDGVEEEQQGRSGVFHEVEY